MKRLSIVPVLCIALVWPVRAEPAGGGSSQDGQQEKQEAGEWIPGADFLLLKLQDNDADVRARNVKRALKIEDLDFRVVELLSRLMDDPANDTMVRLEAAMVVARQNTPYAKDGASRLLRLFNEAGYPGTHANDVMDAVARQGNEIIGEMEEMVGRGELTNNFFKNVMSRIGTPAALVARERRGTLQSGFDRHQVNR